MKSVCGKTKERKQYHKVSKAKNHTLALKRRMKKFGPKWSTTPLWQWGFRQCLPFSFVLRGKHCRRPIVSIYFFRLLCASWILGSTFCQEVETPQPYSSSVVTIVAPIRTMMLFHFCTFMVPVIRLGWWMCDQRIYYFESLVSAQKEFQNLPWKKEKPDYIYNR